MIHNSTPYVDDTIVKRDKRNIDAEKSKQTGKLHTSGKEKDNTIKNTFEITCRMQDYMGELTCKPTIDTKQDSDRIVDFGITCREKDGRVNCVEMVPMGSDFGSGIGFEMMCDKSIPFQPKCKGNILLKMPAYNPSEDIAQPNKLELDCNHTSNPTGVKCRSEFLLPEMFENDEAISFDVDCCGDIFRRSTYCTLGCNTKRSNANRINGFELDCQEKDNAMDCKASFGVKNIHDDTKNVFNNIPSPTTVLFTNESTPRNAAFTVGICVFPLFFLLICFFFILWYVKKRKTRKRKSENYTACDECTNMQQSNL